MNDRAKCINRFACNQDVNLDKVSWFITNWLIIQAGITLGAALHLIEEVSDNLSERHAVLNLETLRGEVFHLDHLAAAGLAEIHDRSRKGRRRNDCHLQIRLKHFLNR